MLQRRHPIRHRSDIRWRKNGSCPSICIPPFSRINAENLIHGINPIANEITPPKTQPATNMPMNLDATTSSNIKIRNRPARKHIKKPLIDQIIILYVVVLRYSLPWRSDIELSPPFSALKSPGFSHTTLTEGHAPAPPDPGVRQPLPGHTGREIREAAPQGSTPPTSSLGTRLRSARPGDRPQPTAVKPDSSGPGPPPLQGKKVNRDHAEQFWPTFKYVHTRKVR